MVSSFNLEEDQNNWIKEKQKLKLDFNKNMVLEGAGDIYECGKMPIEPQSIMDQG